MEAGDLYVVAGSAGAGTRNKVRDARFKDSSDKHDGSCGGIHAIHSNSEPLCMQAGEAKIKKAVWPFVKVFPRSPQSVSLQDGSPGPCEIFTAVSILCC
jgi:hypothetical protein